MIRAVKYDDAESIATIYNYYIINSTATFEEVPVSAEEIRLRIDKTRDFGLPWLISEEDEGINGYAYAGRWNLRSAYRFSAETSVYTSHNTVIKGLGTQLYKALFAELHKIDIKTVIGILAVPNDASVSLHEKFGMKKVAHLEKVGFKFDRFIDVGFWQGQL